MAAFATPVFLNSHTNSVFLHSRKRPASITDNFFAFRTTVLYLQSPLGSFWSLLTNTVWHFVASQKYSIKIYIYQRQEELLFLLHIGWLKENREGLLQSKERMIFIVKNNKSINGSIIQWMFRLSVIWLFSAGYHSTWRIGALPGNTVVYCVSLPQ